MTHRFNILFIVMVNMILITENIKGQNIVDSCIYSPLIKVNLAIQSPQGDLKDYFGLNSNIGCSFGWKNKKIILLK